jgi:hypothetical protein
MSWDKVVFRFTFRELITAAAEGCSLCRWILDGEAIARLDIGPEEIEVYGADVSLVIAAYDDHPESRRGSLLHAVGGQQAEAEVDDYLLVAVTNPPFRNGMGYTPDILSVEYFGLLDPLTKLIRYRTLKGLQLFAPADDGICSRAVNATHREPAC